MPLSLSFPLPLSRSVKRKACYSSSSFLVRRGTSLRRLSLSLSLSLSAKRTRLLREAPWRKLDELIQRVNLFDAACELFLRKLDEFGCFSRYGIVPNRLTASGFGLVLFGQVWIDTVLFQSFILTDLASKRIDGSSRFSDRVRISDRLTTSFITIFFLEVTYPHLRVVLVRAAIKDPERVLYLTLMPQVCSFEHWDLTDLWVIFSTKTEVYCVHS